MPVIQLFFFFNLLKKRTIQYLSYVVYKGHTRDGHLCYSPSAETRAAL